MTDVKVEREKVRVVVTLVTAAYSLLIGLDLLTLKNDVGNGVFFVGVGIVMIFIAGVNLRMRGHGHGLPPSGSLTRPTRSLLTSIGMLGFGSLAIAACLVIVGLSRSGLGLYFNVILALGFLLFGIVMLVGMFKGLRTPR